MLALLAGTASAQPRVASINLCTDQLVAAIADPAQVLGFSPYYRGPAMAHVPRLSGTAEELLVLRPEMVLTSRFVAPATRALLRAHGVRLEEFGLPLTLDDVRDQMRRVGALLGRPAEAEREVSALDAADARARLAAAARARTVLPLQRRGWSPGSDSLMTSVLAEVGLRNAGPSGMGGQVGLEQVAAQRPDLLLVGQDGGRAEDQGRAFLQHPALARLYPPERRVVLPERLTVCGGPALAKALDTLADAVKRLP